MVSIEPNKQSSGFFVPLSVGKAHCSPLIDQMGCEGQAGSGASESECDRTAAARSKNDVVPDNESSRGLKQ